jgi:hypothetical protein
MEILCEIRIKKGIKTEEELRNKLDIVCDITPYSLAEDC